LLIDPALGMTVARRKCGRYPKPGFVKRATNRCSQAPHATRYDRHFLITHRQILIQYNLMSFKSKIRNIK
jgi:hypothetical protein